MSTPITASIARVCLAAAAALFLVACATGGDNNGTSPCDPPCGPGLVCDPVKRVCVVPGSTPQCTGGRVLCRSACVDTTSDRNNCGGCGKTCGYNATCVNSQCACQGTFSNCNTVWADGCECAGPCEGTKCAPPPTTGCDPDSEAACDQDHYCDITAKECVSCPQGQKNCDLVSDCECASDGCVDKQCKPPEGYCDPTVKGVCGGPEAFCVESTQECMNCAKGFKNCDGDTVCECEGLCDAQQCATCEAGTAGSCDAVGKFDVYCDGKTKTCKPCDEGKKNCDGEYACECDTVCEDGACKPEKTPCDPNAAGDCGDESMYCDQTTDECDNCPDGKKNCDKKGICECEHTCVGTECQTPCDYYDSDVCDSDQQKWCYNGECLSCTEGFFNCDHTEGCECPGGCDGTDCISPCASCDGCCDGGVCLEKAAQTSGKCGSNGDDCVMCPIGTFCQAGQCIDCATNCPAGCCNWVGDCVGYDDQTDTMCGDNGEDCKDCAGAMCMEGGCWV